MSIEIRIRIMQCSKKYLVGRRVVFFEFDRILIDFFDNYLLEIDI